MKEWIWGIGALVLGLETDVYGRNALPLSATNFTRSGLGSKPVLLGNRPKTSRMNQQTNNHELRERKTSKARFSQRVYFAFQHVWG